MGIEQNEPEAREEHLSTEDIVSNLNERTIRGGFFVLGSNFICTAFRTAAAAILARLLVPESFGLLAMVVGITGFLSMFKDFGLSMATIQREDITDAQISNLFWVNVAAGVVIACIVAALAPAVAWFYREPRLTEVTLALAPTFLISAISLQHRALLRRQMRFSILEAVGIASQLVGIVVAIALAASGARYWALVARTASISITGTLAIWIVSPWRPGLPQRTAGMWSLLSFGGNMTAGRIVDYAVRHLDNIFLGWAWGPAALGFYRKAYQLLLQPLYQIGYPLTRVALPALCRLQDQPDRYRAYVRKGLSLMTFATVPLVAFALVEAREIVLVILGEKWLPTVNIYRAMAPAAFVQTFGLATSWGFIPSGRVDKKMKCNIVVGAFTIAAYTFGLRWGAIGVAAGFSAAAATRAFPQILYAFHGTPLRVKDVLFAVSRPLVAASGAAVAVLGLKLHFSVPAMIELVGALTIFAVFYAGIWCILPGGFKFMIDGMNLVRDMKLALSGKEVSNETQHE